MKIAILTLPLHTNYGGILQAYALQTVLQRMGNDVTVINQDLDIHQSPFRCLLSIGKFLVRKYLSGENTLKYVSRKRINRERMEREKYTQTFIDKYINTYTIRQLATDIPKCFDAFIVGSDQIWRSKYVKDLYRTNVANAFLKFAEGDNVKRIAYAPSFGTDDWEYTEEETNECARLLGLFDAVSVREESAIKLCQEYLGRIDVKHVLDPTMLLTKEEYIKLVEDAHTPKSKGDLMCYILDETDEKQQLVQKIAEDRGYTPFYANSQVDNSSLPNKDRIQPPLEQWLRGFIDAEFVVTDSFHACAFSIIFNKPFVVIGNKGRGMARFSSLLSMFSLAHNLINSVEDYNPATSYDIPEESIKRFADYREESIAFLKSCLSK